MFYDDLMGIQVEEIDTEFPLLPKTTPIEDKLGLDPSPLDEVRFKINARTKRHNEEQTRQGKARVAQAIHRKILIAMEHMTPQRKTKAIKAIKALRPSIASLKAHYKQKGEPQKNIDLLVTPESYPNLPNVWITKRQCLALLDVLDGKADQHKEFINNGFY